MAKKKKTITSVEQAWNTVALEERIELISKVQSQGILAGTTSFLLIASIAYGLDQVMLLIVGLLVAFCTTPMMMGYTFRREKPALILAYLSVRALAKRYAFAYRLENELQIIYRAKMWEGAPSREIGLDKKRMINFNIEEKEGESVWVCLFDGGLVVLAEKEGGARLAFITTITNQAACRKPLSHESTSESALVVEGTEVSNNRKILLDSNSVGAQYVLEKKMSQYISEYIPPVSFSRGIASST